MLTYKMVMRIKWSDVLEAPQTLLGTHIGVDELKWVHPSLLSPDPSLFPFLPFSFKFPLPLLSFHSKLNRPSILFPSLLSAFFFFLVVTSLTPAFRAIPLAGTALAWWLLEASQILVKNTAILGQTFLTNEGDISGMGSLLIHLGPKGGGGRKNSCTSVCGLGGQRCEALGSDRNKSGVSENCETCAVNVSSQQKWVSPQAWAQIWLCSLSK